MSRYGCLTRTHDHRDYTFRPARRWTGESVDLSGGFPEQPYDQGNLGSCVAQGTAAVVDYARNRQNGDPIKRPSRLHLYWWGRSDNDYPVSQDTGLEVRDGLGAAVKHGSAHEDTLWPYDIAQFATKPSAAADADAEKNQVLVYGAVAQSDIDSTIASGYPVVFGFDVYRSFESVTVAKTGIMPVPSRREPLVGGHCVVACSTPVDGSTIGGVAGLTYRLCRNSWGTAWGLPSKPGYFYMPVPVMHSGQVSDLWMITSVEDPDGPTPPQPPAPTDADATLAAAARAWLAAKGL